MRSHLRAPLRKTLYTSSNAKSIAAWLVCAFLLCGKGPGVILCVYSLLRSTSSMKVVLGIAHTSPPSPRTCLSTWRVSKGMGHPSRPRLVCGRAGRPVCLHPRECWEGQTDTPPSSYPHRPLYDARKSDRTLGGGGSHPRGCHDRSPWACRTPAQIWLVEGARRPVQSSPAPGTGRHRHTVSRVTVCADRRERQWWNAVGVETVVTLVAEARPSAWGTRGPWCSRWVERESTRYRGVCGGVCGGIRVRSRTSPRATPTAIGSTLPRASPLRTHERWRAERLDLHACAASVRECVSRAPLHDTWTIRGITWDTTCTHTHLPVLTPCGRAGVCGRCFRETPTKWGGAPPKIKVSANSRPLAPARPHMTMHCPCPRSVTAEPGRAGIAEGHPARCGRGRPRDPTPRIPAWSPVLWGQAAGGYSRQAPPVSHRRSPRRAARHPYQTSVSPARRCVHARLMISRFLLPIRCGINAPEWLSPAHTVFCTPERHRRGG